MTAILNIAHDLFFQFRINGALLARLSCVASFYFFYVFGRFRGLTQGGSREYAFNWFAKIGMFDRTVTIQWPLGMRLELDVWGACLLPRELTEEHMYDRLPRFRPQAGQYVVDVGCQQGTYTALAALLVGASGKVIAIEAMPENIRLLRKNILQNQLSQVIPVNIAAADSTGEARFGVFKFGIGGSLTMRPPESREISVPVDTLDNILAHLGISRVDLIKIDVEGACLKVLLGAARILAEKPRLVMEVEGGEAEIEKVRRYVEGLGYRTQTFDSIVYAE
jgi:FkbM family methyltransferase